MYVISALTLGWIQLLLVEAPAPNAGTAAPPKPIDLVWMAGPPSDAQPRGRAPRNTAALRKRGAALFNKNCAICHGESGDGKGLGASHLDFKPTDLSAGVFKVRSTPSGTLPTDTDLFVTISRGMHGTEMFPWHHLSERDRWAIVSRIKSFSPRFAQEKIEKVFVVPRAPVQTEELVEEGRRLFVLLRCNTCHGTGGDGDGPASVLYAGGGAARPVRVRDFTKGQFLRGQDPEDIYLTLLAGLDGSPMGPYETLSSKDLWALSAFVRDLIRKIPMPDVPRTWDVIAPSRNR